MSEELRAREVLAQFCDRDGHPETARILRSGETLNAENGGRTCIDAMISFASSAAGQREGWKPLVYSSATPVFADNEALEPSGFKIMVHTTSPVLPTTEEAYAWAKDYIAAASPPAPEERRDEVDDDERPLTAKEAAMIDRAWERHVAAGPQCDMPPAGWRCTRGKGHVGPCAAVPDTPVPGER